MKKLYYTILTLLLFTTPVIKAQQNSTTRFYYAFTHEEITISSSAVTFTSSIYNPSSGGAQLATFTISCSSGSTCPINFLIDGGTPTTSVGQGVDNGAYVAVYALPNIINFKAIRSSSVDAVIHVIYYR